MSLGHEDGPHIQSDRSQRLIPFARAAGRIGSVARLPGGGVTFQFAGLQGRDYIIQTSTNLITWMNLSTQHPAGGAITFTDPGPSTAPARFYRLQSGS